MASHSEVSKALKGHAALNGATVTDGVNAVTIDLDTANLDLKALADIERMAQAEGHTVRIAKGTAGTGSPATLVIEPR